MFYTPPPDPSLVVAGQVISSLRQVGTFDPNAFNEVRQNAAPPLGADGFVPPTLLSVFAFEQTQFHNGAALSFDEVLDNVTHRSAGTGGVDTLSNAADRAKVAAFPRQSISGLSRFRRSVREESNRARGGIVGDPPACGGCLTR